MELLRQHNTTYIEIYLEKKKWISVDRLNSKLINLKLNKICRKIKITIVGKNIVYRLINKLEILK